MKFCIKLQVNSNYGIKNPQGTKNPFELRGHSIYRGSSCRVLCKRLLGNLDGAKEFARVKETFEL